MRHKVDHRKLNRTTEHRLAMLNNQAVSLIQHDRITTTLPKAKELRRFVERLVTLAKKDTLHARRIAARKVKDTKALQKLFSELGPLYASRPGGYTRIMKLGFRRGDGAQEAIIEMVDREPAFEEKIPEKKKKKKVAASVGRGDGAKEATIDLIDGEAIATIEETAKKPAAGEKKTAKAREVVKEPSAEAEDKAEPEVEAAEESKAVPKDEADNEGSASEKESASGKDASPDAEAPEGDAEEKPSEN